MRERGNKNGIVIISIPIVGVDEGGRGEGERGDRDKDREKSEKGRKVGEATLAPVNVRIRKLDSPIVNKRFPEALQEGEGEESQEQQDQDKSDDNESKDERSGGDGGTRRKYNWDGDELLIRGDRHTIAEEHRRCHITGCPDRWVCKRCIEAGKNSHSFSNHGNYKRHCENIHRDVFIGTTSEDADSATSGKKTRRRRKERKDKTADEEDPEESGGTPVKRSKRQDTNRNQNPLRALLSSTTSEEEEKDRRTKQRSKDRDRESKDRGREEVRLKSKQQF